MAHFFANSQIYGYSLKGSSFLNYLLFFVFLNVSCATQAQNLTSKSKKAIALYQQGDNFRVRGQFPQAIQLFTEAVAKDKNFAEAHYLLGVCQARTGRAVEGLRSLETAVRLYPEERMPYGIYMEMATLYFQLKDFASAESAAKKYLEKEKRNQGGIASAKKLIADIEFTANYKGQPFKVEPRYLTGEVNQFPKQYFPSLTADQKTLVFTKIGPGPDEDIMVSELNEDGSWGAPKSISKRINTLENEGTSAISADGRTMVFTMCGDPKGMGRCDLYISYKKGEEWSYPINLGGKVNTVHWESQPSLSADGRLLFFVSDRPGGKGGRDIWKSELEEEGFWSTPVNLGDSVNTILDELSPFIHFNNVTLYFSSNGHPGFGGFDLFKTEQSREGWGTPLNIGPPVNTSEDQLSLFITTDGKEAYYSLETMGGMGAASRLVTFTMPEEMRPSRKAGYIEGVVTDKETGNPLSARVELFNLRAQARVFSVRSDSTTGKYLLVINEEDSFSLYADKKGYLPERIDATGYTAGEKVRVDIKLNKVKEGRSVVLRNLFFDFNSTTLKRESYVELGKVIQFLSENPEVKIQITGYTDNVGTVAFNKNLSIGRAKSVFDYLVEKGIAASRVTFSGAGSANPIVPNDTEENRALNRRIEFSILK